LTLRATAKIEGDVFTDKLSIEPGATFNATCSMKGAVKSISGNAKKEQSA
jgi:cytoskeletal protein CcmA (bactofilin family)